MAIKVDSPATLAEKYIIKSIWNNHFPQGSLLPAERELSDLVGVTRTTLREVLQRLARDGWITIQHGKQTRVNNFMEVSGLNILDSLVMLDEQGVHHYLSDAFTALMGIASVFIPSAVNNNALDSSELIRHIIETNQALSVTKNPADFLDSNKEESGLSGRIRLVIDKYGEDAPRYCRQLCLAHAFSYYDYCLFKGLANQSGNILYVLTMNGLRNTLNRLGGFYFMQTEARELALSFYRDLQAYCDATPLTVVADRVRLYSQDCTTLWSANHAMILRAIAREVR